MAASLLSTTEARQAAVTLDAIVESRIDLALTPAVLAKLAARGITESSARAHLRQKAAAALLTEHAA